MRNLLDKGVNVGLGVDGTASNDSGHMIAEARLALFLQRSSQKIDGAHEPPGSMLPASAVICNVFVQVRKECRKS